VAPTKGEVEIAVKLSVPTKAGRYAGAWKLVDAEGVAIKAEDGNPMHLWLDVTAVEAEAEAKDFFEPAHGGTPGHYWADRAFQIAGSQEHYATVMAASLPDREAAFQKIHDAEAEATALTAKFLADVTLEDGTEVEAGATVVKTWRLEATGDGWPAGAKLIHANGHNFGVEAELAVAPTKGEVEIAVKLSVPTKAGRYVGSWKLVDAEGAAIKAEDGNPMHLWLDVTAVEAEAAPAAAAAGVTWAAQGFKPFGAPAAGSEPSSEEEWTNVAPQSHRQPEPVALPGLADADEADALVVPADEAAEVVTLPPPVPPSAPVAEKPAEEMPFATEVAMMESMGFTNSPAELAEMLKENRGDVGAVIARLLQ